MIVINKLVGEAQRINCENWIVETVVNGLVGFIQRRDGHYRVILAVIKNLVGVPQGVLLSDQASEIIVKIPLLIACRILRHRLPARPINLPRFIRVALRVLGDNMPETVIDIGDHQLPQSILSGDNLMIGIIEVGADIAIGIRDRG